MKEIEDDLIKYTRDCVEHSVNERIRAANMTASIQESEWRKRGGVCVLCVVCCVLCVVCCVLCVCLCVCVCVCVCVCMFAVCCVLCAVCMCAVCCVRYSPLCAFYLN